MADERQPDVLVDARELLDYYKSRGMGQPVMVARLCDEVERLRGQLPAEMQNCTIVFKECSKGHGWLTATNWVQHGCPTCALATALAAERAVVWRESITTVDTAPGCHSAGKWYIDPVALVQRLNAAALERAAGGE